MKRSLLFFFILFFVVVSVFSVSVRELLPNMNEEKMNSLISGEVVSDSSANGDICYLIPKDALITSTANVVFSYEKGFAVGATTLIPYPEKFEGMNKDELILSLYNYGQSLSTLEGIKYISHRAGDKPKVLFEEASTLSSSDMKDKTDDWWFDSIPEYCERYVYLKDTSFGKNVYRIEYKVKGKEIALEMRNSSELKFMGIGLVAPGKVAMSIDMMLTDEGVLFSGVASVKDKEPKLNLLVYTIDLEESIMNRVIAIKDWYFRLIGD